MINALNKILSPIKPYGTLIIFPTLAGLGAWILYDTHSRIMSPSQFDMSIWDTIELYIALTLTAALLLAMLLTPVILLSMLVVRSLDINISGMVSRLKSLPARLAGYARSNSADGETS